MILRTVFVALIVLLTASTSVYAADPVPSEKPFAQNHIGENQIHHTAYEDTLVKLARDYNLGFNELRAANPGVDPWMPGEGVDIVLPTMHILPDAPHEGVVINLPEMRFYAFLSPGEPPITHPIGVGREGLATPTGTTTIVRKMIGPVWRPTARMRKEDPKLPEAIGPGKDNPMGTHALYFGWPTYAMHGTNKPYGIGRRVSSGCIRLYPEDIVTFFDLAPVGTKVRVVEQPVKAAWIGDDLYMEAHPSMAQADDMENNGFVSTYEFSQKDLDIIMKEAGEYDDLIDWQVVRDTIRKRHGVPVVIATKPSVSSSHDDEKGADESGDAEKRS